MIVAIDGQAIQDYPEMQRLMRRRLAGERVATLRVRRGQEELDLRVVLAVPEDIGKSRSDDATGAED